SSLHGRWRWIHDRLWNAAGDPAPRRQRSNHKRNKHQRKSARPAQLYQPAPRKWRSRNRQRGAEKKSETRQFEVTDEDFPSLPSACRTTTATTAVTSAAATSTRPGMNYRKSAEIGLQEELLRKYSRTLGSVPAPSAVNE